jgi:hypothetical protein
MGNALAEQYFSNFKEVGKWLNEYFATKKMSLCKVFINK